MFEQSMAGHGGLLVEGMLLMTRFVDSFYKEKAKWSAGPCPQNWGRIAAHVVSEVGQSGNK